MDGVNIDADDDADDAMDEEEEVDEGRSWW